MKESWKTIINKMPDEMVSFIKEREKVTEIYPPEENIFQAFSYFDPHQTKVVILGQDPYHTAGCANGLAFSTDSDKYCPPSLRNIINEMLTDVGDMTLIDLLKSKSLKEIWGENLAKQGVLLLNTALTVEKGKANSHKYLWSDWTEKAIKTINEYTDKTVWILWGKHAQQYKDLIDTKKHKILESTHPSPFSAYRGFTGSKPFSACNEELQMMGRKPIQWLENSTTS